jgi:beta-ribofuranosylaminobenzene 5'-phosphate synthase
MRAIVETGARLHLGFLDLNGQCGRLYGSIGVTLERPRCVVEAGPASAGTPPAEPEVEAILARLDLDRGPGAIAVRVAESIPSHAGFGSGTQLALSVALAATRAAGRSNSIRDLAQELGRGRRSGIGVAAFERGGLVIDAGQPVDDVDPTGIDADEPPPVIFQHPLPDGWHFVLATPRAAPGLSGAAEQQAFRDLPPMAAERVGRICRLALTQVAPATLTDDIRTFGAAITEIQAIVGEYFAPHQGGRFATQTGCEVTEHALAWGAHGVGQSSWGPAVFALTEGEKAALALADSIRTTFGHRLARVDLSRARNRGASCDVSP